VQRLNAFGRGDDAHEFDVPCTPVLEGRWRTDGTQTPEFIFPNGEPIPLKRGTSWIEVVPTVYEVLVNATPDPES
jgi:hypothetical protein